MIKIEYTIGGIEKLIAFPNSRRGQQQSLKYIQTIYKEWKEQPYFFNKTKIELVQAKLDDRKLRQNCKKRFQLETELRQLTAERELHLSQHNFPAAPGRLIIKTTTE